jgi:hypothetical protein
METRVWKDTGISIYGSVKGMFVDSENKVTLQAIDSSKKSTFHRFALQ